ncbi:MAG TPA: hypothetical protein V6C81_31425 [Planktothrix sp.]|jgi:predicted metal-dependent peptidase
MTYRTQRIGEKKKRRPPNKQRDAQKGFELLGRHPLFAPLLRWLYLAPPTNMKWDDDGWCILKDDGILLPNYSRQASPDEWCYMFAHCVLHHAFGHSRVDEKPMEWSSASDIVITRFLQSLKVGIAPAPYNARLELPTASESALYDRFCQEGVPVEWRHLSAAGRYHACVGHNEPFKRCGKVYDWSRPFARGLENAIESALNVAAGIEPYLGALDREKKTSHARKARSWIMSSFPLLGSLAASFELIEDPALCARMNIPIAAVHAETRELYINPSGIQSEEEHRFVMAHEFLHVALRHHLRRQGRDPYLWNVACDYVINAWLIEMNIGVFPEAGGLYDAELKGLSAEAIYDRIVTDMRRFRKLTTLRGRCDCGDIIDGDPKWWNSADGMSLDEFYRRCLAQGLEHAERDGRGVFADGLLEEIRSLLQPPVPWDVELARWFENYFPPIEKIRSYARPSRRQASTPDIPRPSLCASTPLDARTFGVVLDTSGSMDRELLGKALGAIVSYSMAHEVPFARVIHCDAVPYDQGYVAPEAIASKATVKGRGGTVLQPAIDLLERAKDFPDKGPILIITDGYCDELRIRREHAFLVPEYAQLPFRPKGPVFRIS